MPGIGYYVHHQGRGHLHRAIEILTAYGGPATVLSSLPRPPAAERLARVDWVRLPRDDGDPPADDPTAHGRLHWVPAHHPGLRRRMAAIAGWIERSAPSLVVVDVSVEVMLLCRLLGVPVVAVAMPGSRRDPAHRLGYDVADALLACWPREVLEPPWPSEWTAKTRFVGALSRYDARIGDERRPTGRSVVVLLGAGGHDVTDAQLAAARRATPGWEWTVLGGADGWCPDPWPLLRDAEVVVTHAGQNALAEVAAARAPAIVIPQRRPHGEQEATATAVARAGLATLRRRWPEPAAWPALLSDAARAGGRGWRLWCPGDAAATAAARIGELVRAGTACAPR
jgi:predicted glycosyltransferase